MMIQLVSTYVLCILLTAKAFQTITECKVGNSSGICMLNSDCHFRKNETSICGKSNICCLDSGISEKKCSSFTQYFSMDICQFSALNFKIIGGSRTAQGEFPYMVAIGKEPETSSDMKWFCGGSIVSEKFVITAGHCLNRRFARDYMVLAGATNVESPNAQLRHVEGVIIHPKFAPWKAGYDLALLKVTQPFEMSNNVYPICLLRENILSRISKVIATGYGLEEEDTTERLGNLMKVKLNLFSTHECTSFYPAMVRFGNKPSIMCAGYAKGGKDTCQGDSGGPLAIPLMYPACEFGLAGITSSGTSCGSPNSPGIYIKVSYFLSWIERNVWHKEMEEEEAKLATNEI